MTEVVIGHDRSKPVMSVGHVASSPVMDVLDQSCTRVVMTVMMPSPNKWCDSLRARHSVFCGPCPDLRFVFIHSLLVLLFSGATGSRTPHYACRGMNAKIDVARK